MPYHTRIDRVVDLNVPIVLPGPAARIRVLRGRLGLTQARLAELMGVSFVTVSRWENGQSHPSRLALEKIARAERLGLDGFSVGATITDQSASGSQPPAPAGERDRG